LQHALQPSLKIDEPYAAYTVTTANGLTLTGLLVEQTPQEVVVRAEKRSCDWRKTSRNCKGDKSLMPERILSDLTAQSSRLFEPSARKREEIARMCAPAGPPESSVDVTGAEIRRVGRAA
jgi:hypothetical protein